MSPRRIAPVLLLVIATMTTVQLSGAVLTSTSTSAGVVGSSPDWTPPVAAVSPSAEIVRGTASLSATATDTHSSVRSVLLQVRPAGSTGAWIPLCTSTTAPYTCSWTTTSFGDGRYDVQAVATDAYGNTAASAVVQRTVDNLGPVVAVDEASLPEYLRGTVTVSALATDAGSGIASVRIQRSTTGTTWSDLCTDTTAPYSCAWATTGSGDAFLRAVAVDVVGNTTTSAVVTVSLDNTAPSVTMTSPGTTLSGAVTLTASAADADSGVASVVIEYRTGSTSPWIAVCTDGTAPYSCRWDTTQVADGTTYAFRATATDQVGLTTVSAVTTTSAVDNRLASVSVEDPGQYLRGTVALVASANAPSGVKSVALQYAPTGTSTWTTVCTATAAPYTCAWDTTKVAGGTYDLRAVMTPVSGSLVTSALVTGRIVDNAPLRGFDVQVANGGIAGRVDVGDTLSYTYDSTVNLGTVLAGWTGQPRQAAVRLRDGAAVGGLSGEDVVDVFTATGLTTPVPLGLLNTRGNHIKNATMTFAATMSAEAVTVNGQPATRIVVRLDALASPDVARTLRAAATMSWTPSGAVRDLAGNAAATAPVEELGVLDRDF